MQQVSYQSIEHGDNFSIKLVDPPAVRQLNIALQVNQKEHWRSPVKLCPIQLKRLRSTNILLLRLKFDT